MPSLPISQLPVANAVNSSDLLVIVQGGVTKQASAGLLGSYSNVFSFLTQAQIADVQAGTALLDVSVAVAAAITATNVLGGTLYFPPGVYMFAQGSPVLAGIQDVVLQGSGVGATVFRSKVPVGTPAVGSSVFLQFTTPVNVSVRDITFDMNSILTTAANTLALSFIFGSDLLVEDIQVINGTRLGVGFNGSSRWTVQNCYFRRLAGGAAAVQNNYQNEAVLSDVSGGAVVDGRILSNVCDGWGVLCSGLELLLDNNKIQNFGYGGGITINADASTSSPIIIGNQIKNGTGLDVNATQPAGIECWAPGSVIKGNICKNNAGSGIAFGGKGSVVSGNICTDNGSYNNTGSGISVVWFPGWTTADHSLVEGNVLADLGSGHQQYGYAELSNASAAFVSILLRANSIYGNTIANYVFSQYSLQGEFEGQIVEQSAIYDPASIPVGTSNAGLIITVAGASVGDFVLTSCSSNLQGLILEGYVTSANQVQILLSNVTGTAVDLPSSTFRARVFQHR